MPGLPAYVATIDTNRPFRAARPHTLCLGADKHILKRAGVNCGFDHGYWLSDVTCLLCREHRDPRATWIEIDHLRLGDEAPPTHARLRLTARRPVVRGSAGRIIAELDNVSIAEAHVRMCEVDARGVIERIEVTEEFRHRGLGVVLLESALARGAGYRWSTAKVEGSLEARSFAASMWIPADLAVGEPHLCSHMREANGEFV